MRWKYFLLFLSALFSLLVVVSGCNSDSNAGNTSSKESTNYSMLFKIDKKLEEKNDEGKTIYVIEGHNLKDGKQKFKISLDRNVWNLTKKNTVTYEISFDIIEGEEYGKLLQISRAPNPG